MCQFCIFQQKSSFSEHFQLEKSVSKNYSPTALFLSTKNEDFQQKFFARQPKKKSKTWRIVKPCPPTCAPMQKAIQNVSLEEIRSNLDFWRILRADTI